MILSLSSHHTVCQLAADIADHFLLFFVTFCVLSFQNTTFKFPLFPCPSNSSVSFVGFSFSPQSLKLLVCCAQSLDSMSFSMYMDLALQYHLSAVSTRIYRSALGLFPNPGFCVVSMTAFLSACMSNRHLKLSVSKNWVPRPPSYICLPPAPCLYPNPSNHPDSFFISHTLHLMH